MPERGKRLRALYSSRPHHSHLHPPFPLLRLVAAQDVRFGHFLATGHACFSGARQSRRADDAQAHKPKHVARVRFGAARQGGRAVGKVEPGQDGAEFGAGCMEVGWKKKTYPPCPKKPSLPILPQTEELSHAHRGRKRAPRQLAGRGGGAPPPPKSPTHHHRSPSRHSTNASCCRRTHRTRPHCHTLAANPSFRDETARCFGDSSAAGWVPTATLWLATFCLSACGACVSVTRGSSGCGRRRASASEYAHRAVEPANHAKKVAWVWRGCVCVVGQACFSYQSYPVPARFFLFFTWHKVKRSSWGTSIGARVLRT